MLAPIVLFVYNRHDHTMRTIESLKKNDLARQSDLIIFSDASKNVETKRAVSDVRKYIATVDGFKSLKIVEREQNFGLAKSIIYGVTEVVEQYGKAVVLEDDLIVSPYFLQFMNDGLNKYEHDPEVISIHGYVYPVREELPPVFFLKGADCWGWATWKRGWNLLETDGNKLLSTLEREKMTKEFNFDFSYPYVKMLRDQIRGKNDSWAILWYASAFVQNKLTLYPGKSLVKNVGLDGSGTHCGADDIGDVVITDGPILLEDIPLEENQQAKNLIKKYFRSKRTLIYKKFKSRLKQLWYILKKL